MEKGALRVKPLPTYRKTPKHTNLAMSDDSPKF